MAKTQTETFIRRSVVDALRRAGWFVIYNMQMGFGQHRGLPGSGAVSKRL